MATWQSVVFVSCIIVTESYPYVVAVLTASPRTMGAAPIVRGEAFNTASTYGYDSVTMMQETKTTLCEFERA